MGVFKRGNVYYAEFFYQKKRMRWSTNESTKKAADEYYQNIKRSIRNGTFESDFLKKQDQGSGVKISEAADWYLKNYAAQNYVPKSLRQIRYTIGYFVEIVGDKLVSSLTRGDIEKYKTVRLLKVKKDSVDKELAFLSAMLNRLEEYEIIPDNPVRCKIKLFGENSKRKRTATIEELVLIFRSITEEWFKVYVLTAYLTGLRLTDILNLRMCDIDLDRGLIPEIKPKKTAKSSGKTISVALSDFLVFVLRRYVEKFRIQDRLFLVPPYTITHKWGVLMKELNIPDLEFRDLRRTFSTRLYNDNQNADIKLIADMMGHAKPDITSNIYTRTEIDKKRNAVNNLEIGFAKDFFNF